MEKHDMVGASVIPHCNSVHHVAISSNDGVHVTVLLDGNEVLHATIGE